MIEWIVVNKEWLFSGAGIVAVTGVLGIILRALVARRRHAPSQLQDTDSQDAPGKRGSHPLSLWLPLSRVLTLGLWRPVTNGLVWFNRSLHELAVRGGEVFTTAVFENYTDGDKVREQVLALRVGATKAKTLNFTRLVVLDDPTQELSWIRDFLRLRDEISSEIHGFVFQPAVKRIATNNRALIHRLVAAIPRMTLTLIKLEHPLQYVAYIGVPNPPGVKSPSPGILFTSKKLYRLLDKYVQSYCGDGRPHIETYTETSQLPNIDFSRTGLSTRIADAVEELALVRSDILHVGLFGSCALSQQNLIAQDEREPHEADIDLMVVVSSAADVSVVKEEIVRAVCSQHLSGDAEIEIEWSNLDGKYYEYRAGYHVDVQLHRVRDRYYVDRAPLLGHSIFCEFYTPLYTRPEESIEMLLDLPARPISTKDRADLVVYSQEYGMEYAIEKLSDLRVLGVTDPRRVLWISLGNAVWALAGERPRTKKAGLKYLRTYHRPFCDARGVLTSAEALLGAARASDGASQVAQCQECVRVITALRDLVQGQAR